MAVDHAGNLYIADTFNERIRKVAPTGVISTTAILPKGSWPHGVGLDATGNLYVAAGLNAAVLKISPRGIISTVVRGNTISGGRATVPLGSPWV